MRLVRFDVVTVAGLDSKANFSYICSLGWSLCQERYEHD
jgi:hypothetical protein